MKKNGIILLLFGIVVFLLFSSSYAQQQDKIKVSEEVVSAKNGLESQPKTTLVDEGDEDDAENCLGCHSQKTPGIVASWKKGKMGHESVSCSDCHVVEKNSPMASQCEGVRGTDVYTSPMVSSATCSSCHPDEVEQFQQSAHANLAVRVITEVDWTKHLMYVEEGQQALGVKPDSKTNMVPRNSCQMCHGTQVEVGADNKPVNMTWPGGIGTRYPDGSIGNCTACHTRHQFSIEEARKPEACSSCHLGGDHPQKEIYEASKHGQVYEAHGVNWNFEKATDTWGPGDYDAPTCAVCHMSGIGELSSTHNINERLKWNLHAPRSEIRSNERGDGVKGEKLMKQVCSSCHSSLHTDIQREVLDETIALYNVYWDKAVAMKKDLTAKNLLGKDKFNDGFNELMFNLYHSSGRRFRMGTAMHGSDIAQYEGLFQMMQIFKDLEAVYNYRIKNNKIEELSHVMDVGPS